MSTYFLATPLGIDLRSSVSMAGEKRRTGGAASERSTGQVEEEAPTPKLTGAGGEEAVDIS